MLDTFGHRAYGYTPKSAKPDSSVCIVSKPGVVWYVKGSCLQHRSLIYRNTT